MARKTRRRASKRHSRRKQRGGLRGQTGWNGNPVNYDPLNAARYRASELQVPPTYVAPERPIENLTDEIYRDNMNLIQADDPKKPSRNILHRMMAAIANDRLKNPLQTLERYVNENRGAMKDLVNGKTVGKWLGGGGHTPLDILDKHCKPPTCSSDLKVHLRQALQPFIKVEQSLF